MGPYCPIYGFGALLMLLLMIWFKQPVYFVIAGMLTVTVLEYVTAVLLKKLLKLELWTYKNEKFNFQGRISLKSTIAWGALALLFWYWIEPAVRILSNLAYNIWGIWPAVLLISIIVFDFIFTITHVKQLRAKGIYKDT